MGLKKHYVDSSLIREGGESKNILLMFSGGLDSLFTATRLLDRGHRVVLQPVSGPTHSAKKLMESAAREKAIDFLKERYSDQVSMWPGFEVMPDGVQNDQYAPDQGLTQPVWLTYAIVEKIQKTTDYVVVPYLGDDGVTLMTLGDMVTAFNALRDTRWADSDAELVFPMVVIEKSVILEEADPALFEIFWTCETPVVENDGSDAPKPCLTCAPCRNLASGLLSAWMERRANREDLANKVTILNTRKMIPEYFANILHVNSDV